MSAPAPSPTPAALEVRHLSVAYRTRTGRRQVLDDVSFRLERGASLGLIGESGCGKSTLVSAIMADLPRTGEVLGGEVLVDGEDLLTASPRRLRELYGGSLGLVSQDAASALNPSMRLGDQVVEAVLSSTSSTPAQARARALELFRQVHLRDPEQVLRRYPHEISGGQQQRVFIAMALAAEPEVLLFDEPTTGLDATVEAEVLDLIDELRRTTGVTMVFISHDLGLVTRVCDQVGVLYAGRLVETGETCALLESPRHPYTEALTRCVPTAASHKFRSPVASIPGAVPADPGAVVGCRFAARCPIADAGCRSAEPDLVPVNTEAHAGVGAGSHTVSGQHLSRCRRTHLLPTARTAVCAAEVVPVPVAAQPGGAPLLRVDGVSKSYGATRVLSDVSLTIQRGEILGLVGESGSGKSTLARLVAGLTEPSEGTVELSGRVLPSRVGRRDVDALRAVQMVFQHPDGTLNPRVSVGRALARAAHKLQGGRTAAELGAEVSLPDSLIGERPRTLSGGQKQRVAIARAFAGDPALVLADEPVSALDSSVQASVLNLLVRMQSEHGVGMLFISHDIEVVRYLADRVAVMQHGRIVETGPTAQVLSDPQHEYTAALVAAADRTRLSSRTAARPARLTPT